jgi:predicted kinase
MLIVLSGLPGVGKTTIARELACALAAVYLRIDSIEQALRQAGLAVKAEGYAVAHAVAADNLRAGQTVVADCVNPSRSRRRLRHYLVQRFEGRTADRAVRPWPHRRQLGTGRDHRHHL